MIIDKYMKRLLRNVFAGDRRALARMMSLAEAGKEEAREALAEIYRRAGAAHIIGLTGVPGSGKSTLLSALVMSFRRSNRRVGVVAVDPSSPYSGGAILGDRVRMADLAADDGVFIRSLATRGNLGGLAPATLEIVDILDAAGFDLVIIETVGVGQDEVDIANASHTVVVVSAPGLGDDIQAMKAGVLEIADIHAVSKSDELGAHKTVSNLRGMLGLGLVGRGVSDWTVPIISTSARTGQGVEDLMGAIDDHGEHLRVSGAGKTQQLKIAEMRVLKNAEYLIRSRVKTKPNERLNSVLDDTVSRLLDPQSAARILLRDGKLDS